MKKVFSLLLLFSLLLCPLVSCGRNDGTAVVGTLAGPTGMGMAKMLRNENEGEKFSFELYSDPTVAVSDLVSGKLDFLCLPTNTAATLANKEPSLLRVIAVNCLGSLYLMTDEENTVSSFSDLEGKTIHTSVAGSTTRPILSYLLEKNGVHAEIVVEQDHDALIALMAQGKAPIAVLPEPKVSAALASFANMEKNFSVDLDLSAEWEKVSDSPLAMGCIVVRSAFLSEHPELVEAFARSCRASVDFIRDEKNAEEAAESIVDAGILPKLPIAKSALSRLRPSLVYLENDEMKSALTGFYEAIGCAFPENGFFYEK